MSEFENIMSNKNNEEQQETVFYEPYEYQDGIPGKKYRKISKKKLIKKLKKANKDYKKKYRKLKKRCNSMEAEVEILRQESLVHDEQLKSIHRYMVKDCMDKLIKSDSESDRRRLAASLMTGGRTDDWSVC